MRARIVVPRQAKGMLTEMGQAHDDAAMLHAAVTIEQSCAADAGGLAIRATVYRDPA